MDILCFATVPTEKAPINILKFLSPFTGTWSAEHRAAHNVTCLCSTNSQ